MFRNTRQLLLTAMSVCAACALLATPAFADDDKRGGGRSGGGGGGGDDQRGRVTTTTTTTTTAVQRRDDRGRGDDKPVVNAAPQAVQVRVEHEDEHQNPGAVVTTVVDNRGPGNAFGRRDHDDEEENVVAVATLDDLVAAINNEVAALTNANVAVEVHAEENEVEVEHLQVINLATLTAGLSAADAATVTSAVNANTSALQSFLASGGANANAIDAALNALGVAPSSVIAIVSNGEQLIAVTA
jgi:hypothetical protein